MTTKKARKLLGQDYKNHSNKEIDDLVNKMGIFADALVDAVITRLEKNENNEECSNTNQSFVVKTSS